MVKISHVSPSGDMARKAYYDRNALSNFLSWEGSEAGNQAGWTTRWSYTVPANRSFIGNLINAYISTVQADPTRFVLAKIEVTVAGATKGLWFLCLNPTWTGYIYSQGIPVPLYVGAGAVITAKTWNYDTVAHGFLVLFNGVEFDA